MSVSSASRKPARPTLPNAVGFALTIALVWLGGQFVTQGLSDRFLGDDPELAVLLRGDSSDAVAALARKRLTTHDNDGALRLAGRALQLYPLNAGALTSYGFASDQLGRPGPADQAMSAAGELGWRDELTQVWLLRRDLLARRYASALDHGDAVMRRQDVVPPIVLAVLAAAAKDPNAVGPIERHLANAPNWRLPFFVFLTVEAHPPATDIAGTLLSQLAGGSTPPTGAEQALFLRRLGGDGRFDDAASAWRKFHPKAAAAGYVNDGDFETASDQTPFDWMMIQGVGWAAGIYDSPAGGGEALQVSYDGVSPPMALRQTVILPPGRYRLSGRAYLESGTSPETLAWRLACVTTNDVFAQAPTPSAPQATWTPFSVELNLPAGRCPAEWLQLTAEPGDVRKDIVVWYDDIAITPFAASPAIATSAGDVGSR